MSSLDSVLKAWEQAFDAACAQVELHRVLGFPATVLPARDALRRAALAALGARHPLEKRVAPHLEALRAKGVLATDARPSRLNAGVLVAIDLVLPHLRRVMCLVDGLAARAASAPEGSSGTCAPRVRAPESISATRGQTVRIEIECEGADRLVLYAPALGMTRVLLQPAERLHLDASLFPGELIVYAENNTGSTKVVRPMTVCASTRAVPSDRRFSRTVPLQAVGGAGRLRRSDALSDQGVHA